MAGTVLLIWLAALIVWIRVERRFAGNGWRLLE